MDMKEIFLLRHGDIGCKNKYIGSTDIGLSPLGEGQIKQLQERLSSRKFDLVFASPLQRCVQTYNLLGLDQNVQNVYYDDRLREIDFGEWEEKTFAEIVGDDSKSVEEWSTGNTEFCFPQGEKIHDFQARILNFVRDLYDFTGRGILIISHGGVIRYLICALLNLSFEHYLYFKIDYARLTTVQLFDEGGVLSGLNRREL